MDNETLNMESAIPSLHEKETPARRIPAGVYDCERAVAMEASRT